VRAHLVLKFAICVALVTITWAVFGQTLGHDFVNYDDNKYVYENANVAHGLTVSGMRWAFSHFDNDNWHPLTSISHMVDCQLFGLKPGGHHFTNLLLHIVAAVLLFFALNQMTNALWRSAFVAAIFAIHPLHVESVAWIAERKDVLSAVFFMLTLGAYAWYARQPSLARYLVVAIIFACGLMSKAMLVTLPIVLLFLDYWPLNRFRKSTVANLVLEKIPLLLLSSLSSALTLRAQQTWEIRLDELSLWWRIANAASACVVYIWQMLWPVHLAVIYPHEEKLPLWQTIGAIALLLSISVSVFLLRKSRPYLAIGWGWYLIMLLPVIGLIKVGALAHADRYTYLPQIGLYLAGTWGIVDLTRSWSRARAILALAAAAVIILFAWHSWIQTSFWRDSETLWRQTLATTKYNDLAHFTLAEFLSKHQRVEEAIMEYQTGLSIDPKNSDAETNLANLLLERGRTEEAVIYYGKVVRLEPASALAHYNFAIGLHRLGRLPAAIAHYKEALRLEPGNPDADYFLGQALLQNGQPDEARLHLEKP
jgi:tetratricopeptide (TPR) repeat protein